jgi:tetratricopeptide (TPR) repeat protein
MRTRITRLDLSASCLAVAAVAALFAAAPTRCLAQDAQAAGAARAYARALAAAEADTASSASISRATTQQWLAAYLEQEPRPIVIDRYGVFGESSAYESGISALDADRWQAAVDQFNRVIKAGKTRVDGALYWKAYALNRLGQRAEAQATLQELFKNHPASRYLNDARALDIEIKQRQGQPVNPEDQANDDLKSIAFSGLMRSDPERAITLGQQLLRSSQSPKLKQQILFALALNATPKAQEVVSAIARGGPDINPDLQMKAIKYLGAYGRDNTAILGDVYRGTTDADVKRQIIRSLGSARDDKQLLAIARSETSPDLRVEAIGQLGSLMGGSMWVLNNLSTATPLAVAGSRSGSASGSASGSGSPNVRIYGEPLRLGPGRELPKTDVAAIGDALVQIYRTDKNTSVRKAVISALGAGQNAKALVEIARAETSPEMKREIVSELSSMKSKEATDYLMEILK